MKKRNLFEELTSGLNEIQQYDEGKITLKTANIESRPPVKISGAEIIKLRNRLNVSRPIFASYLRIKPRTLENWEQGRSNVSAEGAVLIKLIEINPESTIKTIQGF